jgi:drug/metabolite transporter (DMT)-like permease
MILPLPELLKNLPSPLFAALLLTSGISILGLSDNLVRFVSDDIGLGQYHFLRSVMSVLLFLIVHKFVEIQLRPIRWAPVLLRTLFMSLSMTLFFSVLSFLPVALAGAGLFTSPIFVLVFSFLFFGVRPGWRRMVAVICGSAGVWLVLRPDAQAFHLIQLLPVLGGAFYAAASLTTRHYCADESPHALSVIYFFMIGFIGLSGAVAIDLFGIEGTNETAFLLRGLAWPSGVTLFWMAVMTGLSVLGIWMITRAYQLAETSYMSIFEYCYLISAGIFGWLLWGSFFGLTEFMGMGLISAAGALIALSAGKAQKEAR